MLNLPAQKFPGTLSDPIAVSQPWLHMSLTGSLFEVTILGPTQTNGIKIFRSEKNLMVFFKVP